MNGKVIVITGASGGIGAAFARLAGSRGGRPVLAARRAEALREVAAGCGPDALVVAADVTQRADVVRVRDEAIARFGHIDVWVNNAGRGITIPVSQLTDEDVDDMFRVNVKSALYGMQAVLPHFRARGRGHIINVSSMLGRIPYVHARSAYSAAKAALNSLTTSLRLEVHATHPEIQVSTMSPGVVATDFGLNARGGGPDSRALPYCQPVEEVALALADLIERPRAEAYSRPGLHAQVAAYYAAESPEAIENAPPFAAPRK